MQRPRGEKVLRCKQFGKCYVQWSVYYQMQSFPHCRALHVPTDPHLRASHDRNTVDQGSWTGTPLLASIPRHPR